jgi:acetoacetyl-CoA synthetase
MTTPPVLWQPTSEYATRSTLTRYTNWLSQHKSRSFEDYAALWQWSVTEIEPFWETIWQFFQVQASTPYEQILSTRTMPGARWFPGATLNFAEHIFRNTTQAHPAVLSLSETRPFAELSWQELHQQVTAVATALRSKGLAPGDRVAAFVPNIPEALIAFLACASIGAIWSSCSPDFGVVSVVDRFKQIEPKMLFAIDGYTYGGKTFDRRATMLEIQQALPSLQTTVLIPYLFNDAETTIPSGTVSWEELINVAAPPLAYEQVPFDHPLWVLYSSGTTGLPKPIVQSHGGILLELFKGLGLHLDIQAGDRFFWQTTTGWMMWNFLIGGLLLGSTIVLYDGNPVYPDRAILWDFATCSQMTFFGTNAAYLSACMKAGLKPSTHYDLSRIKGVGSTGSPLAPDGFDWVYEHINPNLMLASISGGTDVCTAFVGSCPWLPVYRGEIQCRWLGAHVVALDEQSNEVTDTMGELVIKAPMPSMPIFFWNDPQDERYRASYFTMYPGWWRHGDWVTITSRGSVIIHGRSDSTINRQGVRMGTGEIYRVVEGLAEVADSLVVDIVLPDSTTSLPLFVVLAPDVVLTDELIATIKQAIRTALSPRHVPDRVFALEEVPYTLSGKKMEVPIRRILMGETVSQVANPDSMRNPKTLDFFVQLAAQLREMHG